MKIIAKKVSVLIAVKNGMSYLPQQINSILSQQQCQVSLYISDDCSTDGSGQLLKKYSENHENIKIIPKMLSSGSASKNFYRLILEADINEADYFAFADQDDIWFPNKLMRHIELAREHDADGVSSNVTAFWPDGRQRLLDKAQPQRELDYLFESAGPGCTFLMSPWLIGKMKEQLLDNTSPAKEVELHDWLTYAVCRGHGRKWVIDNRPSLEYRQHQTNVVGANVGLAAKLVRLRKLRQQWYRNEITKIAKICYKISSNPNIGKLLNLLELKDLFSRLKLLSLMPKARRKSLDRWLLAASILLGLF